MFFDLVYLNSETFQSGFWLENLLFLDFSLVNWNNYGIFLILKTPYELSDYFRLNFQNFYPRVNSWY